MQLKASVLLCSSSAFMDCPKSNQLTGTNYCINEHNCWMLSLREHYSSCLPCIVFPLVIRVHFPSVMFYKAFQNILYMTLYMHLQLFDFSQPSFLSELFSPLNTI